MVEKFYPTLIISDDAMKSGGATGKDVWIVELNYLSLKLTFTTRKDVECLARTVMIARKILKRGAGDATHGLTII